MWSVGLLTPVDPRKLMHATVVSPQITTYATLTKALLHCCVLQDKSMIKCVAFSWVLSWIAASVLRSGPVRFFAILDELEPQLVA